MGLNELEHMGRIIWETLFVQLPAIEAVDKQFQRTKQRFRTARKAPRPAGQASQVMPQLRIVAFHRIGVPFPLRHFIPASVVPQPIIDLERIAIVPAGFGGLVDHRLRDLLGAFPAHLVTQEAAGATIDECQDVDPLFFSPMKVNSSSSSASLTSSGTGGSGSAAAWALTHKETVR